VYPSARIARPDSAHSTATGTRELTRTPARRVCVRASKLDMFPKATVVSWVCRVENRPDTLPAFAENEVRPDRLSQNAQQQLHWQPKVTLRAGQWNFSSKAPSELPTCNRPGFPSLVETDSLSGLFAPFPLPRVHSLL